MDALVRPSSNWNPLGRGRPSYIFQQARNHPIPSGGFDSRRQSHQSAARESSPPLERAAAAVKWPQFHLTLKIRGPAVSAKYYIRSRKEENPKKWQGPFDVAQLRQLADRRLFSKELHEYSEDRANWTPAKQIWPTIFPKSAKTVVTPSQPDAAVGAVPPAGDAATYALRPTAAQPGRSDPGDVMSFESVAAVEESADWFYASNGSQQGPVTLSQLRQFVAQGTLQATDLVWCPPLGGEWVEAQTVPEVYSAGAASPFPDFNGMSSRSGPAAGTPPLALASLILGLLGTCLLFGVGSILAVIFGHIALADFKRREGPAKGKGLAIAGIALGYSMIGIIAIATVVYLAIT